MRLAAPAMIVLALAGATGLACAPSQQQPRGVSDYFPLGTGHHWVYRVTRPDLAPHRLEFRIRSESLGDRGERRFHLDESGERYYLRHGKTVAYSVSPGIWTVFLDGPLRNGRRFDGARATYAGFTVEGEPVTPVQPDATPVPMKKVPTAGYKLVTATNRRVTVPAGTFENCLEVTHVALPTIGVKYFAPGVGMVYAEAWLDDRQGGTRTLITRQELVEYHVAGRSGGDATAAFPAASPKPASPDP